MLGGVARSARALWLMKPKLLCVAWGGRGAAAGDRRQAGMSTTLRLGGKGSTCACCAFPARKSV